MAVLALRSDCGKLHAASSASIGRERHASLRIITVSERPRRIKPRARARAKLHDAAIKE